MHLLLPDSLKHCCMTLDAGVPSILDVRFLVFNIEPPLYCRCQPSMSDCFFQVLLLPSSHVVVVVAFLALLLSCDGCWFAETFWCFNIHVLCILSLQN